MIGKRLFIGFILFIISLLLCLDLFLSKGRPSTFDGPSHLANIAQFTKALQSGDFPVRWMDGFGNYGMPMAIIIQQTTSYLGAIITLFTHDIFISYNIVVLIGAFFSTYLLYCFFTLHFSEEAALLGATLFNFAPYRIINIYIRGALPEFFSHVFFPVVFIGLYLFIKKRSMKGLIYLFIGFVGILLTHPFTFIIGMFIWVPYAVYLVWESGSANFIRDNILYLLLMFLLVIGISAFYIIPLYLEIKYFYYGTGSHFIAGNFLTLKNYLGDQWYYFYQNDIEVRGHVIHLGLIESLVITAGMISLFFSKKGKGKFLYWIVPSLLVLIFFTTHYADFIFKKINLLGNIQHNWRLFTSIVFIAPLILAYLLNKVKSKTLLYLIFFVVIIFRFPQLYGKNYLLEKQDTYYWTKLNLAGNIMNTVWTGPTQDYPVKKIKGEILEGKGKIIKRNERNSWREYEIKADTDLRLVDYTFYFPGWKVYVDKKEVPIEFQDMNYRGVITYKIPKGKHTVLVKFTDTKVRLLANMVSLFSLGALGVYFTILRRRAPNILSTTRFGPQ